ncbi:MAG: FKBP-type peptidyl-prolyl cis-trans isomerase [Candidatus Pacebacteria bacterium]|nr:FKBP-type peptidyl-prolyl cis-trans isomerase [Candidatus Paceibacterota bacterium]MBP9843173.1 FKBP-type peptidyl-prolyl cis-trans isomerase [Candidatus Paceibacterota bacterium]
MALKQDFENQLAQAPQTGAIVVGSGEDKKSERVDAYLEATNDNGKVERMVIEDVKMGEGSEVKVGDTVAVHYVGTLQDGTEFDNSKKRGQAFEFKVGGGQVIKGWDEGLLGMKVGGQRILVIPSDMAYGEKGIGPIPGGATLVFSIELIAIK